MEAPDLGANLEFWSGRARSSGAGEDPDRRPPRRRLHWRWSFRAPGGKGRPVAAAVLLAALTAGWLVAGHSSRSSGALPATIPIVTAPTAAIPTTVAGGPTTVAGGPTTVPRAADCGGLSAARPEVRCTMDAIDLDVWYFAPGAVTAAYEHATGVHPVPGSGPAVCARGVSEERSWSIAATPGAAVGRYLCRFENGRAAMWWTHGNRLVHAVARDADLAGLFSWWRAHPSE